MAIVQHTQAQADTQMRPQKKVYAATMRKTRAAMNRLLNEFLQEPEADTQRFRAQIYALKAIADTHRADVEERLAALEDVVQKDGGTYLRRVQ